MLYPQGSGANSLLLGRGIYRATFFFPENTVWKVGEELLYGQETWQTLPKPNVQDQCQQGRPD